MASILKFDTWQTTAGVARQIPLQIVQATTNGGGTFSSSEWTEVFSATITPSSTSSKILVQYNIGTGFSNATPSSARIRRNTTVVGSNTAGTGAVRNANTVNGMYRGYSDFHTMNIHNGTFLDSPATTSTITYRIDISPRNDSGAQSWRLGQPWSTDTNGYQHWMLSSITLWEIQG